MQIKIVTDLSKAFDCLPHKPLIATLHAYGFGMKSRNLIYDYLSNGKQRFIARNVAWGSTGINSRAITIHCFSLWFILLSRRYGYNKLCGRYHPFKRQFTQKLHINELEETCYSFQMVDMVLTRNFGKITFYENWEKYKRVIA